jgi:hypothetical protein
VRRGPSEAELAKAFLHQQARAAALVLEARSNAEVAAVLDAATRLPKQDIAISCHCPGCSAQRWSGCAPPSPTTIRGGCRGLPATLAEVDTPLVRAGLVRAVQALRDTGRVSDEVAAAVAVEQGSGSTTLLRTSLLAAVAVSVGAARIPAGLLVVSRS